MLQSVVEDSQIEYISLSRNQTLVCCTSARAYCMHSVCSIDGKRKVDASYNSAHYWYVSGPIRWFTSYNK